MQEDEEAPRTTIDIQFFSDLFLTTSISDGSSYKTISLFGGLKGIAHNLGTDLKLGYSDQEAIKKSVERFGNNSPFERELTSLWDLVCECLQDTMLQILCVAALCATVVGMINTGVASGWTEGATIFLAVFLIVSITSGNNYVKERQF